MTDIQALLARLDLPYMARPFNGMEQDRKDAAAAIREQQERVAVLEKALHHITNPLKWEQDNLKSGYTFNGQMLLTMLDNPEYYKSVAREALRTANGGKKV